MQFSGLIAKKQDERALESRGRGELASAEPDTNIRYCTSIQHSPTFLFVTSRLLREVYYLLYANKSAIPSKVAFDPEERSLGRIRADSIAPPHSPASIKRCISRAEGNPALADALLFVDISSDTPLKEGPISILHTDGPGLSPDEPMAIVQIPIVQVKSPSFLIPIVRVKSPSILNGRYVIKN
jgi:hypothetical protein